LSSIATSDVTAGGMPPVGSCSGWAVPDDAGAVGRVAHQLELVVVDDEAVLADLELAIARVARGVHAVADLEEAAAVDGEVHRVLGRRDVALRELLGHRLQRGADTDLVLARTIERGRVDVGELGPRALGAIGTRVGDVVADDVEVLGRGVEPGKALLEAHGESLLSCGVKRFS
jgi:hypothetical protein